MAIKKKLSHFKTFANFNSMKLSANVDNTKYTLGVDGEIATGEPEILYESIVWIKDTKQQWTHGQLLDFNQSDVYVADFTYAQLYNSLSTGVQVDCQMQPLLTALDQNKTILVRKSDDDEYGGAFVLNGYYEDLLYFSIADEAGNVLVCDGTPFIYNNFINDCIEGITLYYRKWADKQDILVSGTNIKTVNGNSLLGSGDITIEGGGDSFYTVDFTFEDILSLYNGYVDYLVWDPRAAANALDKGKKLFIPYIEGLSGGIVPTLAYWEDFVYIEFYYAGRHYYIEGSLDDQILSTDHLTVTNVGKVDDVRLYDGTSIVEDNVARIPQATTSVYGVTKLTSSLNSASQTVAAAARAVQILNNSKQDNLVSGTNIKTINGESILGKGDLTISGGSSSGGGAYAEVSHGTSDTTFTLTPNTFHIWDEVTTLDLELGAETSGVANEYLFQFTSGANPTTLTLPDDIKWANDTAPTIAENMIYQVSILKGLASVLEFPSSAELIENKATITNASTGEVTFQYPVTSEITVYMRGDMPVALTFNKGEQTKNYDELIIEEYTITSISPSQDNVYYYTY